VLCFGFASALMDIGEVEVGETYLKDAERWGPVGKPAF